LNYDIIGDIHGHAEALEGLLRKLGYREHGAHSWRPPAGRIAIFLGDFIDKGPGQLETVRIARGMIDAGDALAVMGNHELNAIAWFLPDGNGDYLRRHTKSNLHMHEEFLAAVDGRPELHKEIIDWFLTLPLWIDLPELRVVHACWHPVGLDYLSPLLGAGRQLTRELMPAAVTEPEDLASKDTPEPTVFKAVEWLTKGIEIPMPLETSFVDAYGKRRDRVRVQWWDLSSVTYRQSALLTPAELEQQPEAPIPQHARLGYPEAKPLFFGHYWWSGTPRRLAHNLACVDYSVAKKGRLCAYQYGGEPELDDAKFVSVAPNGA
jgi:hypothetical protein